MSYLIPQFESIHDNILGTVTPVHELIELGSLSLPSDPGVYAFWWIGDRQELMTADRRVVLAGPGGSPVAAEFDAWWPEEAPFPCLYVGKTTGIRKRVSQHILLSKTNRLHQIGSDHVKVKLHNSTCQLRYGIEHIFRNEKRPVDRILNNVGLSYSPVEGHVGVVTRFYAEDWLIGFLKPWFNLDSER